ncbi:hypothetical protein PCCS19_56420 [Paenibacillus sp. CCS19]|uniref:hypothetical protein n=1 Tax=Paenibacillus sp. CCS19 TaxID=3158387 RepID=UPI002568EC96|nr:hypothetical protein [Paenibacillus cellulosilyticus]GMK42582.1 hypothetical protein PCCS19_56420 [Paenibacillus cellulosilyticus]
MYEKLIAMNDHWTEEGIVRQLLDQNNRFYGGTADEESGLAWPTHTGTAMVMAFWASSLASPASRYYRDELLTERLELASSFMLRFQHEDGTVSPNWTNMHSPPDTGFVIVGLAQVLELMEQQQWAPLEQTCANLRLFLERTVPAMLTGGCHTPNHRWVLTAALGFLYRLTGKPELEKRANEWLSEGMDLTPDGEWTERSNGIYNAVSDVMLYHASELLRRPALLGPIRRNLKMMTYLVHPDGEVVTDYSGRQDFGSRTDMSSYHFISLLMAHRDSDSQFAALAKLAGESLSHPGAISNNSVLGCLLRPELLCNCIEPGVLPDTYRVVINGDFPRARYLAEMEEAGHGGRISHSRLHPEFGAPVARERQGMTSTTVMAETNAFFALRHGQARLLAVSISSTFEPGFIRMNGIETVEDGYRLSGMETKGYYSPIAADRLPQTAEKSVSPWYLLPHHLREATHLQEHHVKVELDRTAEGYRIRMQCDKQEALMTQVSFVFGREGEFQNGELAAADTGIDWWKNGTVRYAAGQDWIELSGGSCEHSLKAIRNAPLPSDCRTLLVNLVTPYDQTFQIKLSGRS